MKMKFSTNNSRGKDNISTDIIIYESICPDNQSIHASMIGLESPSNVAHSYFLGISVTCALRKLIGCPATTDPCSVTLPIYIRFQTNSKRDQSKIYETCARQSQSPLCVNNRGKKAHQERTQKEERKTVVELRNPLDQ